MTNSFFLSCNQKIHMGTYHQQLFDEMPIVGIMRNYPSETIKQIIPSYLKAGLNTLEITMNSHNAEEMIYYLSKEYPNMNIGAGTVCEMRQLIDALNWGASFIVTPILNEEVIKFCKNNKVPIFPGAMTPTEIYRAWKLGATAVKIFPSAMFGPAYVKEIKGPLNDIKLLPTGGVTLNNIQEFFKNGASGVGMGGSLFDAQLIADQNYDGLYHHFALYAQKVKDVLQQTKR